jgi:hypothetical protein
MVAVDGLDLAGEVERGERLGRAGGGADRRPERGAEERAGGGPDERGDEGWERNEGESRANGSGRPGRSRGDRDG